MIIIDCKLTFWVICMAHFLRDNNNKSKFVVPSIFVFFCVLRYLSGDLRLPTLQLENCFIILRTLREKAIFGQMVIVFVPQIKHLNYSLSTGHSRRDWETTEKMMNWLSLFELSVEKCQSLYLESSENILLLVSIYL